MGNLTKQELVAFDDVVEGFEEALLWTRAAKVYRLPAGRMSMRGNDTIWRPMHTRMVSQEGLDQTGNFANPVELAVPANVDRNRSVPFKINPGDARDETIMKNWGDEAKLELASIVNDSLRREASFYSSIVDVRTGEATGFKDVAKVKAKMDKMGVRDVNRIGFYSSDSMINMAENLASRQSFIGDTKKAYEDAYVNKIAGFDLIVDSSPVSLPGSTVTGATINGTNQRHIPVATKINAVNGNEINVDNRSMVLKVNKAGGTWQVGDAFTIAGVYAVHLKNKKSTGDLKTFRVIGVNSDTEIEIVPAIVAVDSEYPTYAEQQYQNVTATPASGAAITMLNKVDSLVNVLYAKDMLEIIPSKLGLDPADGWNITKATLSNGMELYYSRQGDINDLGVKCRYDIVYGTVFKDPEQGSIQLFNQGG